MQNTNLLLEAGNEAVFIIEGQRIVQFNPQALHMFVCPEQTMRGLAIIDLFAPDYQETVLGACHPGESKILEVQAIKANKTTFDARLQIKTIPWKGLDYVSLALLDISGFLQSQRHLLAKDALLEAVNFAAARFLESKNWRNDINQVLKFIGKAARVDRVYIFENFTNDDGKLFMRQQYEWAASGVESQINNPFLKELYYDENGLTRLRELLSQNLIFAQRLSDLNPEERAVLEMQGILSIYITPIFQGGRWWGFIGYDECNYPRVWNENEAYLLNTVADIFNSALEKEMMEGSIKRSWENFKTIFENSPDSIFVYNYQGNVLDVNEAACLLNGYSKNEFIGKHISNLVPDGDKDIVMSEFVKWTTGEYTFVESTAKKQNGEVVPVEIMGKRITYFDSPAVVLLVRDISERRKNEKLLSRRLEFIQFISQISSEFIKIDLREIDKAVNKALEFVCKFTENERAYVFLLNASDTMLLLSHEYCDPAFKSHKGILDSFLVSDFTDFVQTLRKGDTLIMHFDEIPDNAENANMRRILETLQIKSFINIPLHPGNQFLGFIGFDATSQKTLWNQETVDAFNLTGQIITNIIVRKKSEDELIEAKNRAEQSDKLKTAFLGQISHEMRTPLNSIIGFAEMMKAELQDSELGDMAEFVLNGGQRLLNTFNLVIDLSEIEANVIQTQIETINLNNYLLPYTRKFIRSNAAKGLAFRFVERHRDIKIKADKVLLEKIVFNLMDNAIKYTHQGKVSLIIGIENEDGQSNAVIAVKDTGIGILAEKAEEIFNNFRQASEGYNRDFEGAGLGLSVTRGLVHLMGGHIRLESSPGKGSEFKIYFALQAVENLGAGKKTTDGFSKNVQDIKPRVLVVEDELSHQKYLTYLLKKDYHLSFADEAEQALEMLGQNSFDLIIMDINLGEKMNGLELIGKVRKTAGYEKIPAIAATSNVMKGHKELFLSHGFTHYISKPFNANEMKALLLSIYKAPERM